MQVSRHCRKQISPPILAGHEESKDEGREMGSHYGCSGPDRNLLGQVSLEPHYWEPGTYGRLAIRARR